jgi:hypothetical protein
MGQGCCAYFDRYHELLVSRQMVELSVRDHAEVVCPAECVGEFFG